MKSTLNFTLLVLLLNFFSCNKENFDQNLSSIDSKTISERGLKYIPKCDCAYEIVGYETLEHSDNRYWFKGIPRSSEDLCPNCPNAFFEGWYNCSTPNVPGVCVNGHIDPVPSNWWDFNCALETNTVFDTNFKMDCCIGDVECLMDNDLIVKGILKYKIHCKFKEIAVENNSDGFSSFNCNDWLSTDVLWLSFDSSVNTFGVGHRIKLGGDCGCTPEVQ